jgi:transcriptional regulator of met regulon
LAESEPEGAAAAILENIRTAEATIARADRMLQPLQGRLRDAYANLRKAQAAEIDKRADKLEKELGADSSEENSLSVAM